MQNDITYNVKYALYFPGVPKYLANVTMKDISTCYESHQLFAFLVLDSKKMVITFEFRTDQYPEIFLENYSRNIACMTRSCLIVHSCDYCGSMSKSVCGLCKSSYYHVKKKIGKQRIKKSVQKQLNHSHAEHEKKDPFHCWKKDKYLRYQKNNFYIMGSTSINSFNAS